MKKIIYTLIILTMVFVIPSKVSAYETLLSCNYQYKGPAGSVVPYVTVLCDIYSDYTHECYMTEDTADLATDTDNKESILNWTESKKNNVIMRDYVKSNNTCPPYVLANIIGTYELYAAQSETEANELREALFSTQYVLKLVKSTTNDETAKTSTTFDAVTGVTTVIDTTTQPEYAPVNGCAILGDNITPMIKWAFNLIKLLVPVLIIVLTILEFTKIVISADEKEYKAAINHLIKRIIIGVVIVILPVIISLLIDLSGILDQYGITDDLFCSIFK